MNADRLAVGHPNGLSPSYFDDDYGQNPPMAMSIGPLGIMTARLRAFFRRMNLFARRKRVPVPGCDDAPEVVVTRSPDGKEITLVYAYYESPMFLSRQLDLWRSYPAEISARLKLILVDDGSPNSPASAILQGRTTPFPVRLFRVEKDVRWGQHAARNIAMYHAQKGFCLLTDMDLVIPHETIAGAIYGEHSPEIIYRFSRRSHAGRKIAPHANSWLMTREMFWRVGGYDEALTGIWGTDDDWRRRCVAVAPVRTLSEQLISYHNVSDASTVGLGRNLRRDRLAKKRVIQARRTGWKPTTLTFPYHEVQLREFAAATARS